MPLAAPESFFATCPKGLEDLLARELQSLAATSVAETRAGVAFEGNLASAYRACLWSRLASRILLPLARFDAATAEALYRGAQGIDWREHMDVDATLAVDVSAVGARIGNTQFAALKVKDAIVDQFRQHYDKRPSVAPDRPDLRINLHLAGDQATLSLDLSGESLHRRGYRARGVAAPLKENLAAAILLRADWPAIARSGGSLVDPMCGSATLVIEAALMAADSAPGLQRDYYGFFGWKGHDPALWHELTQEAQARRRTGLDRLPLIRGYDRDPHAVHAALTNVEQAGLVGRVHIEKQTLDALTPPPHATPGLVIVNPPYGERLGSESELPGLYQTLGARLKQHFEGWRAAVFTGNPELGKRMGLRAHRQHSLYNGALACKLLHFEVTPQWFVDQSGVPRPLEPQQRSAGATMLANRLSKNLKQLGKWARREGVTCYRLYDADLPEYAIAVDVYQTEAATWVHVQEYEAPASVDPRKARHRLREAVSVIPEALSIPASHLHFKVRRRQKGTAQYEKLDTRGEFHEIAEYDCRFLVNFTDYLDTGLFLDHRITRRMIHSLAAGRHFLNLFAYTATASVHAARGGALTTTSVDMSRTYLDWARRNLALNGFYGAEHRLLQADVIRWLQDAAKEPSRYGLIFLDPPTFSTSKRMNAPLDIQRDHVALIRAAVRLLERDGVLIFSNNLRRFKMDHDALSELVIEDISRQTIPKDFEHNIRIHNCWKITARR